MSGERAPRWMSAVLWFAAVYNLAWGALVVLYPLAPFAWLGLEAPRYPAVCQCLGMVIGVYGIGYGIAARDPFRHWPIVLVGLLGKIFGPIGFFWAATAGELPWKMGFTILTNDVSWWIPFGWILAAAVRHHQAGNMPELSSDQPASDRLRSQRDRTLRELSQDQDVLVVFLRHSGCTFCREALADISTRREKIEAAGAKLAVVTLGDIPGSDHFFEKYGLDDVDRFSDPGRELYREFELRRGTWWQVMGWKSWVRGVRAIFIDGHGLGKVGGDMFQLPGAFRIRNGRIVDGLRPSRAADRPEYLELTRTCSRDQGVTQ